jgi:hypothetical protein
MNSLRRNFFVQFFVFKVEGSVVDDFFSEIDSDRRNEVRAERFVDVLDQTTRLADTWIGINRSSEYISFEVTFVKKST